MNILNKLPKIGFLKRGGTDTEYFFALNISANRVDAALWGINGKKLEVIRSTHAEYESEEELISKSNYALDEALADFPHEPTKILFGVPEYWLQDDNLKPEYLKLLKRMVKEFDLEPMAFVSATHAISHLLQKQQGVPLTAVVVQADDPLVVSVVKAGKTTDSFSHKRSANLPQDIEKALLTFTEVEVLPSKLVIFGEEKLDRYEEELVSYPWMTQLPFLHLPKIEQLELGTLIQAICFAGASELVPEISFKPNSHPHHEAGKHPHQKGHRQAASELAVAGFVAGDITEQQQQQGDDEVDSSRHLPARRERGEMARDEQSQPQFHGVGKSGIFATALGTIQSLWFMIIPLVVIVGLVAAYLLLVKAQVDVFIDMQVLENAATIVADPSLSAVDEGSKKIPGKIIETSVNGSGKGTASGKKKIGDPAKGSVLVYNKTSDSKTFPSGTVLTGPGGINFVLDSSVSIASQSAVDGGIKFGSSTVSVTASEIGPDGNLAAGKELSIKGQEGGNYSAKVDQAFSGGISKDVTVVTADDQKKLLAQVTADLRKKAQAELQADLTDGMKIIEEGLSEIITSSTYSKKVNDQAIEFTLTVNAKYKGTAYNDNDLKSIVSKLVQTNVPAGFELDLSQTETQSDVAKIDKDGTLTFNAKFKAKLKPKLDMNKLKGEIAGKTPEQATNKLKEINNVIGANIVITPNLPGPLQRLPFLPGNINLEVTAK